MDAWANDYFRTLGFTSIHNLGEYRTSVSDVPRTLFIAVGIEMTYLMAYILMDFRMACNKSWGMIWFKGYIFSRIQQILRSAYIGL